MRMINFLRIQALEGSLEISVVGEEVVLTEVVPKITMRLEEVSVAVEWHEEVLEDPL